MTFNFHFVSDGSIDFFFILIHLFIYPLFLFFRSYIIPFSIFHRCPFTTLYLSFDLFEESVSQSRFLFLFENFAGKVWRKPQPRNILNEIGKFWGINWFIAWFFRPHTRTELLAQIKHNIWNLNWPIWLNSRVLTL